MGILDERLIKSPNIVSMTADKLFNWSRLSSIWMLFFGIACCGIEGMAAGISRYDFDRYGIIPRATPRQADLIVIAGPIVKKMVPVIKELYAQMAEPKYVISMGSCALSGGWSRDSYYVVQGAHKVLPVDVHVPGCHPRPEGLLYGMLMLQDVIREKTLVHPQSPLMVPDNVTIEQILAKANGEE